MVGTVFQGYARARAVSTSAPAEKKPDMNANGRPSTLGLLVSGVRAARANVTRRPHHAGRRWLNGCRISLQSFSVGSGRACPHATRTTANREGSSTPAEFVACWLEPNHGGFEPAIISYCSAIRSRSYDSEKFSAEIYGKRWSGDANLCVQITRRMISSLEFHALITSL